MPPKAEAGPASSSGAMQELTKKVIEVDGVKLTVLEIPDSILMPDAMLTSDGREMKKRRVESTFGDNGYLAHIDKASEYTSQWVSDYYKMLEEKKEATNIGVLLDCLEKDAAKKGLLPDYLKKEHDNLTSKMESTHLSPPPESKKHQGTGGL